MYTKSMTSALAEARAYTEANMKRILQALQDKLSKEGGAAGFDDLRKVAKSMGLILTKDMMKSMPGIKQHRDGDYILEKLEEATPVPPRDLMLTYGKPGEKVKTYYTKFMQDLQNKAHELRKKGFVVDKMGRTQPMSQLRDRIPEELDIDNMSEEQLDEALDVKWDSNKQGWFDKQGRRRYLGSMATNKLMAKQLDKAKKTGDFINPYKLKHGQKPEQVEEAFTRKDFQELETTNDHTEAAKKLINMFGTAQEKKTMADIERRHEKTGYISGTDYKMRQIMVNKYYSRLS